MKDVVKNIFNAVFSFGGFMIIACLALFYVALLGVDKSQAEAAACIKVGMIKVRTEAGSYCAAPANLVEIK